MSVIRKKGESQNGGNKETKHVKFSVKTKISYPLIRSPLCLNNDDISCYNVAIIVADLTWGAFILFSFYLYANNIHSVLLA